MQNSNEKKFDSKSLGEKKLTIFFGEQKREKTEEIIKNSSTEIHNAGDETTTTGVHKHLFPIDKNI